MADAAAAARAVYEPRSPQASPLLRLVPDHLHRGRTVCDDRFAREYGPWRPVGAQVADKFLACGVLAHDLARIRRDRREPFRATPVRRLFVAPSPGQAQEQA
jgi:hypothetical protein